jgi:1-phosphofructokinase family hexose kinase
MILCVAGSPSIDKLFEVQRLVPGEIHRPLSFIEVPGGKGLNLARAAASLGASVVAAGLLAGPAGRWIEQSLSGEKIESRFVWTEGQTRSSLSVADRETGRMTEFYENASLGEADAWERLVAEVHELLPRVSWCGLSGSLPESTAPDGYAKVICAAREAGTSTAVDVRGEALAHAVAAGPDLVKINHHEAEELLGTPVRGVDLAAQAADRLRQRAGGDGHTTAITLGLDGAVLIDDAGAALHGHVMVQGQYPVGSGDCFLAGLLSARDRGSSWRDALAQALGAAAANAQTRGAGCFDPAAAAELARLAHESIRTL